jgi:hypothetical protein
MTITSLQCVPVGNAIRVFFVPPAGATRWRLLRKTADTFSGQDDPAAIVVYDGNDETVILDWTGLLNGTPYFYNLYSFVDPAWLASGTKSTSALATDSDASVDVLSVVRERIDLGLQVEVARGKLQHKDGRIPVLTAPPLYENTNWPVVTVHVNSDASSERGLGEIISNDVYNDDEEWESAEGWLSRWSIGIQGWSLNPDERIALRKAIKRVVIGNLSVFDNAGMLQIDLSQQDAEEFERYSAPVYQTVGTLTCLAPSLNSDVSPAILDVEVVPDYESP